ncbi:hypothetical protein BCR44DRAFT_1441291 [Catenaria anguillulae PL171]|uniref:Uncharacterized protein n=1 Tax=Catenaria anguillulae PL171 TaxID=765915 RepID=A0A1Y2HBD7_9FUNG|nr:hypothetical protein BCR44DRAFT_1441291 [Catenaria anguillulae PL171]
MLHLNASRLRPVAAAAAAAMPWLPLQRRPLLSATFRLAPLPHSWSNATKTPASIKKPAPPVQRSTWRDRLPSTSTPQSRASPSSERAPPTSQQRAKPKRFSDSYLLVEHAPVWNRILLAYANQGRFGKTLDLFNEMKKRGATPDAHSWSHLFTSLGLSTSPNKAAEGQRLFSRLVSDKAQHLTAHSYNAYLKALAMAGSSHLLAEALDKPPENVQLDCATLTIILNAMARATQPAPSQLADDEDSRPRRAPPSMVTVESIRTVVAHISDTGIDQDLFAALCAATAKCRGADPAVPLHLLARAAPQAFGKDIVPHLPPSSIAVPDKVVSHGLIAPMPTKVANWALMMAHRLDTARQPASSASSDATPSKPTPASMTDVGDPLLTERIYDTLSSSRIRAHFDSLSMDVLFAAMAQSQQARRAPVLIRMYLDAYHTKLAPNHLPQSLKSLQPVSKLECNGPDPSHAAFASLLHAARECAYILAATTPKSHPEGAPLLLDLLNHYARATDGELWVRSDSEIAAVAQLGRALILPPAKPMAAGTGAWRAPLKQSKLIQVMDHLLWVLGLRPGARPVRKLHQLPLPVLNQCLTMCMWARANMPKTDRFSKEKWDERVTELEDACRKVEGRGADPEWQGRRVGRSGGRDVVLRLVED